jgi:hypothetical protein
VSQAAQRAQSRRRGPGVCARAAHAAASAPVSQGGGRCASAAR